MAAVSDYFSIGSILWCKTCHNEEIEGEVLSFAPQSKTLILKCRPSRDNNPLHQHHNQHQQPLHDVVFINLALVSELKILKDVTTQPDPPQSINLQRLNTRIRNQVENKRRVLQAVSANVSPEGQNLFIAIAKTIQEVRWRNSEIVVLDEVVISPPYQLENIRGDKPSKPYIRKLVERHIRDLAQNNQSPTVSPSQVNSNANNNPNSNASQ